MWTRRTVLTAALAPCLLALLGCAGAPFGAKETRVDLTLSGGADMNGGAPAQVKVYYLSDAGGFAASDFFAVFNSPEATLGSALIAVDSFSLVPGRQLVKERRFAAGGPTPVAVGAVAAFRDLNGRFIAVKPLAPLARTPVSIALSGNTLTLR